MLRGSHIYLNCEVGPDFDLPCYISMRYAKSTLSVFGGRRTALRTYHKAANPMYCLQHGLTLMYMTLGIPPMTTYCVYAYS